MGDTRERDLRRDVLFERYPGLARTHFRFTSPDDHGYNCFAFAADETKRNWHPSAFAGLYWPPGVPQEASVQSFIAAYASLGYALGATREHEAGVEKVAIYADGDTPLHAARQLRSGLWTSKLGKREDIEHELEGLEGEMFGRVVAILSRPFGGQGVLPL